MGTSGWVFLVYGSVLLVFLGIIAYSIKVTRGDGRFRNSDVPDTGSDRKPRDRHRAGEE